MTLSIILDIIIVLIFVISILISTKLGFVRSIQSVVIFVISILLAIVFRETAVGLIQSTSLPNSIQTGVEATIDNIFPDTASDPLVDIYDNNDALAKALNAIGISEEEYKEWAESIIPSSQTSAESSLSDYIAPKVVSIFCNTIAVIGLFLISFLILTILAYFLNKLIHGIPLLRSANTLMGCILGIILAIVRVLLFCSIIHAFFKISFFTELPFISSLHEEETYILRWIESISFLKFLF